MINRYRMVMMIIKKLVLCKYRRFSLTNIELLEYTPDTNIQIILGTNGSGKSSLVKEMTPLPADIKKDYLQDGYKVIEIEHNGNDYILESGVVGSNKHSFKINDIEQNESGIKKIQLQLVKEHFNITPQIHEILLGNVLFTTMSPSDRKKWLSNISNIDYSYSLSVYNNLKQKYRDIVGGIKLTQSKLIQEDSKILEKDEKIRLQYTKEAYSKTIDNLLDNKINNLSNITVSSDNVKFTLREAKTVLHNFRDNTIQLSDISILLDRLNNNYVNKNNLLTKLNIELKDITGKLDSLNKGLDSDTITYDIEKLSKQLDVLSGLNPYGIDLNSIESIYENYAYIYTTFVSELNKLNDYRDIYFTKTVVDDIKSRIDEIVNTINAKENILSKLEIDLEHILKHLANDDIVCNKCGNTWKEGYDTTKHKQLEVNISKYRVEIHKLKETHTEYTKLLTKHLEKEQIIVTLRDIISTNKSLLPIYRVVIDNNDIQKDSNIILSNANEASVLLSKLLTYPKLHKEKELLLSNLELAKSNSKLSREYLLEQVDKVETSITAIKKELLDIANSKTKYESYKRSVDNIQTIHNKLKQHSLAIHNNFIYKINELRNNSINNMVSWLRVEISNIEKQLHDSVIVEDRIKIINTDLHIYKEKEVVLKILLKELSPTEGLIAKSINSFLNVFINEINNIINSIWSYDMVLLPCEVSDDNDLDYKFQVMVNNDEVVDDISKGSSSMQEIINLAFKIVFMKYLGIINTPLILDEFGKTMDPVHRINAYETINTNLANIYKQIFIISHFESMYGRFNNVDITILSSDNINIDRDMEYNKNIILKYI